MGTVISFEKFLERWNFSRKNIKGSIGNKAPDGAALEPNIPSLNVASATGNKFPLTCPLQNRKDLTCWHACAVMHRVSGANIVIATTMTQKTGVTK